jgi:putative flippase GtrA
MAAADRSAMFWERRRLAPPGCVARSTVVQWLRFAVVGGSNTLLSWCVYAVLERLGMHYLLASGLAFALGALNSYALNRRWTFRSRERRLPEALRFGVVQCVGLAVDVCLLYALVHGVGIHHLIAQALVFPAASTLTFLLSRHWAFGVSRAAKPPFRSTGTESASVPVTVRSSTASAPCPSSRTRCRR